MTQNEIIEMARQAGIRFRANVFHSGYCDGVHGDELEAFAKLVAKHTLMNIDPSKFMSWQEGFEAGAAKERARICAGLRQFHDTISLASDSNAIRARGEA
jgi:hypothetical protein